MEISRVFEFSRRRYSYKFYRSFTCYFATQGLITFRDEEQLEKGGAIKENLLQAIEESFSAVIVLSPNYASSSWCLDELLKILDSKKKLGLQVFPIFYGVDPPDVRCQKGSFAEAFKKHEETQEKMKVQRWKNALEEVANLARWNSKNWHETELIKNVAEKVRTKLYNELPIDNDILVGIESKIAKLDSTISNGLEEVRFIGIWGMGALGKTTPARVVYEQIHKSFEVHCFLLDVREASEKDGLISLQRKLLSYLNLRSVELDDFYDGRKLIKNVLCNRKVLLVLDDVSNTDQLENLAGKQGWFGQGSRIIITTRDRDIHFVIIAWCLYSI